jgi:hypothetical protein
MRWVRCFLCSALAVIGLTIAAPALAAAAPAPEPPTAEQIYARYIAARGGQASFDAVRSLVEREGFEADAVVESREGAKLFHPNASRRAPAPTRRLLAEPPAFFRFGALKVEIGLGDPETNRAGRPLRAAADGAGWEGLSSRAPCWR